MSSSPSDYANNWCTLIMGEKDNCQQGVTVAANIISQGGSPGDAVSKCIANAQDPKQPASQNPNTDAYQLGCYLTAAFSGDKANLCTTSVKQQDGSSIQFPYPCDSTCKTLFTQSDQIDQCVKGVQTNFNNLIMPNGQCDMPTISCMSVVDPSQPNNTPTIAGCSIGLLQNQFIAEASLYQTKTGNPPIACNTFRYGGALPTDNSDNGGFWPIGPIGPTKPTF